MCFRVIPSAGAGGGRLEATGEERGRGAHLPGRWPDFLPTGSRAAQLGCPVLPGSDVWGGRLIGADPLPSLWCGTSGHFCSCLASERTFLTRSMRCYSLPKEFGGRGLTALLGSFCLCGVRGSPCVQSLLMGPRGHGMMLNSFHRRFVKPTTVLDRSSWVLTKSLDLL